MRTLTNSEVKVKSYKIHLMEMVINAIYYNPVRSTPLSILPRLTPASLGIDSPSPRIEGMDQ